MRRLFLFFLLFLVVKYTIAQEPIDNFKVNVYGDYASELKKLTNKNQQCIFQLQATAECDFRVPSPCYYLQDDIRLFVQTLQKIEDLTPVSNSNFFTNTEIIGKPSLKTNTFNIPSLLTDRYCYQYINNDTCTLPYLSPIISVIGKNNMLHSVFVDLFYDGSGGMTDVIKTKNIYYVINNITLSDSSAYTLHPTYIADTIWLIKKLLDRGSFSSANQINNLIKTTIDIKDSFSLFQFQYADSLLNIKNKMILYNYYTDEAIDVPLQIYSGTDTIYLNPWGLLDNIIKEDTILVPAQHYSSGDTILLLKYDMQLNLLSTLSLPAFETINYPSNRNTPYRYYFPSENPDLAVFERFVNDTSYSLFVLYDNNGEMVDSAFVRFPYIDARYFQPLFTHDSQLVYMFFELDTISHLKDLVLYNIDIKSKLVKRIVLYDGVENEYSEYYHTGIFKMVQDTFDNIIAGVTQYSNHTVYDIPYPFAFVYNPMIVNQVNGLTYLDLNENCQYDEGIDSLIADIPLELTLNGHDYLSITDSSGNYTITPYIQGSGIVSLSQSSAYEQRCPIDNNIDLFYGVSNKRLNIPLKHKTVSVVTPSKVSDLSVYPNPATDIINIRQKSDKQTKAIIMFFQEDGNQIAGLELKNENQSISCHGWKKGIYFYKYIENEKTVATGKIIIH